jgi:small-conductance mechanosensitive channel
MLDISLISSLAPSLFMFYMLVAFNFIPEIIGCRLQTLLRNNMIAKHITAFLLLFFLVIYVKPENVDKEIGYNLILSMILYLWFFMTSRCSFIIVFMIILLLISIYILELRKTRLESEENKDDKQIEQTKLIQKILSIVIIVLTIVGFIYYFGQKKLEYRDQFRLYKFVFGTNVCRNSNNYPIINKPINKNRIN